MASELKSDLRGTIDWGAGSGLVISMLEKDSLFCSTRPKTLVLMM